MFDPLYVIYFAATFGLFTAIRWTQLWWLHRQSSTRYSRHHSRLLFSWTTARNLLPTTSLSISQTRVLQTSDLGNILSCELSYSRILYILALKNRGTVYSGTHQSVLTPFGAMGPPRWRLKAKVKADIALNDTLSQSYETSLAIWDHTVLPATRHKWTRPA